MAQYTEPTQFRRFKQVGELIPALEQYHKYVRSQYLLGLVHPDIAVTRGINIKLPSDLPLPTASIGYHAQYNFTTSPNGTFLMSWRPCFLATAEDLTTSGCNASGQLTYNNNAGLTGSASSAFNYFVATGVNPTVSLQRYRMVSSLLKVSYNGSVLNQSGSMLACATFDPLPIALGSVPNPIIVYSDGLVDRFGTFPLIQNGLWNKTINITKDSEGLECLYVPTDPDDYMFQRNRSYYGTNYTSSGTYAPDAEGAHINYIIAGRNLPANLQSIMVDVYYNYEVIADLSVAYILRTSTDLAYNADDKTAIMNTFSDVIKKGGLIKASNNGFSWSEAFGDVVKSGLKYLPKILGAML